MPVEPLTQADGRQWYWRPGGVDGAAPDGGAEADDTLDRERDAERVTVGVERPDQTNWGYDVVVSAFSAANPAILETGRPDELVDFIAACHAMPDPIRVVFDVALGHADEAAAELLPDPFFEGPGMYGLHLNYRQPVVRAILLELQRRKANFGADGMRIDGAQDFTYHDEETGGQVHDDAFLAEMGPGDARGRRDRVPSVDDLRGRAAVAPRGLGTRVDVPDADRPTPALVPVVARDVRTQ